MSNKPRLLVLIGPTAVGKTKLSLDLAKNSNVRLYPVTACRYIGKWILVQLSCQ